MDRNKALIKFRPSIETIDNNLAINPVEIFQNDVIRPIMKFQHELIISLFAAYVNQKKKSEDYMTNISVTKETFDHLINQLSFKDPSFLNLLTGLIVGQMTVKEFEKFVTHQPEYRRRIFTMTKKKILRQWELI